MILRMIMGAAKDFPYETAQIIRLAPLSEFDLTTDDFGGNARQVAILKGEKVALIISEDLKTIGVGKISK
jgi:hypothetical protein